MTMIVAINFLYSKSGNKKVVPSINEKEFIKSYLSYLVGCSCGRYDYKNCKVDYSKCKYEIDICEVTKYINKNLRIEDKTYIEGVLNCSIEKFLKADFIDYNKKIYQNKSIYSFIIY